MCKRLIILGLAALMLSIGGSVFAQNIVTLDQAISYSVNEIEGRLPEGVKVMVLNFSSPSERFSNYVLEEMRNMLERNGKVTVVDRVNLDFILRELKYERSGDISDEAAQSIGRILGAQYVISGSIEEITTNYVIQLKTMPVEPSALQTLTRVGIVKDAQMANLMGSDASTQTRTGVFGTGAGTSGLTDFGTADLNRTLVLSAGAGAYGRFQFEYYKVSALSDTNTTFNFGAPLFLNAELFSYGLLELAPYYQFSRNTEEYEGVKVSYNYHTIGAAFSVFGQYPIQLADRLTLYPLLGIGYDMSFVMFYKGDDNKMHSSSRGGDDGISDYFDFLSLKAGVRLNYNLTENLRLNARFLWDYLLYNKAVNETKKELGSNSTVIVHAPSLFLGVSYVFLRM